MRTDPGSEQLRRYICIAPGAADLLAARLDRCLREGDPRDAVIWLRRLRCSSWGTTDRWQACFGAIKRSGMTLLRRYIDEQRLAKASAVADALLNAHPTDVDLRMINAEIHGDAADGGVGNIKIALLANPSHATPVGSISHNLQMSDRYEEALVWCRRARTASPDDPKLKARLIKLQMMTGDHQSARLTLDASLETDPKNTGLLTNLTDLLTQTGRLAEADDVFIRHQNAVRETAPEYFDRALHDMVASASKKTAPRDSLKWAWEISSNRGKLGYAAWRDAANWGHNAHNLIKLISRNVPERRHEIDQRIDFSNSDMTPITQALDDGHEVAIILAHIANSAACPYYLNAIGVPVCTYETVRSAAYKNTNNVTSIHAVGRPIIETRAIMSALDQGAAVILGVDGYTDSSAEEIPFLGRHIKFSRFVPSLISRRDMKSFWMSANWSGVNGLLSFKVEALPDLVPEEQHRGRVRDPELIEKWRVNWRSSVLEKISAKMVGDPVNLTLAGGIWRNAPKRSV